MNDCVVNPLNGLEFAPEWAGTSIYMKCLPNSDASEHLYPEELAYVADASSLRRNAFSTGRYCAKELLKSLGEYEGPLTQAPDGTVVWPDQRIGSITHSNEWSAAALAVPSMSAARALGINLSPIKPFAPSLLKHIATDSERSVLNSGPKLEWLGTALYSLKESTYKCLRPSFGHFIRFHDVEICDLYTGQPRLRIPGNRLSKHCAAIDIELRLAVSANHVFSLAWWRSS